MPPHSYYRYLNNYPNFTRSNSSWSDGLGSWIRTLKVTAIAGTLGAAVGTVGAIAVVRPHPGPMRHQIVADVGEALVRPHTYPGSDLQSAPLAAAPAPAAPSHPPAQIGAARSPPTPPGWPLLPGARPHIVETYAPEANGADDRAVSVAQTPDLAAHAAETAGRSAPARTDALPRGRRRAKRLSRPRVAALQPAAQQPMRRSPTVIVPPRAPAPGARWRRSAGGSEYWRFARTGNYGGYDRNDWRDRNDRGDDRSDWGGGGGFLGLFGGDWQN